MLFQVGTHPLNGYYSHRIDYIQNFLGSGLGSWSPTKLGPKKSHIAIACALFFTPQKSDNTLITGETLTFL